MNVTVIGDGGWGTAIALLLSSYGHRVMVWGPFEDYLQEVRTTLTNPRYLAGVKMDPALIWTSQLEEAVPNADLIVLAIPSLFYRQVCEQVKPFLQKSSIIVSLTKGFDEETHERMSQVAQSILQVDHVVVLSGPSHAEEVARSLPTVVTAACLDQALAIKVQKIFHGSRFRVYTSSDPLGVEIGGAVKNVIAIAVGASDGLGFGDNTRAALITRGLSEVMRLGVAMGAQPETLSGLAGVGDLIVTCTSTHSRNHSVGERLGHGESIAAIRESMTMVAEGVWNARLVHELAEQYHVTMPISEAVYQMCYDNLSVKDAFQKLMDRDSKPEA